MKKTIHSTTTLNDGVEIPYLGLGTWQARGSQCERAVDYAFNHGYSLIDTAQAYNNERQVGKGCKASGRNREEIFLTTKIDNSNQGYNSTIASFEKSLKDLQMDYVDLLLIHWPDKNNFNRTVETWQALIDLQAKGLCRSIGVSNFSISLTEKLLSEINVVPSVNQVEFHVFLYQQELLEYSRQKNIQIEAYSPIARAKYLDNEHLQSVANKHNKTAAQVMLAWCLNHDLVVIPKTVNEDRIEENAGIFFELDNEDMQKLDNLDFTTRLVK
jgi:diketogulonate reductase-like aldo/keto reductase